MQPTQIQEHSDGAPVHVSTNSSDTSSNQALASTTNLQQLRQALRRMLQEAVNDEKREIGGFDSSARVTPNGSWREPNRRAVQLVEGMLSNEEQLASEFVRLMDSGVIVETLPSRAWYWLWLSKTQYNNPFFQKLFSASLAVSRVLRCEADHAKARIASLEKEGCKLAKQARGLDQQAHIGVTTERLMALESQFQLLLAANQAKKAACEPGSAAQNNQIGSLEAQIRTLTERVDSLVQENQSLRDLVVVERGVSSVIHGGVPTGMLFAKRQLLQQQSYNQKVNTGEEPSISSPNTRGRLFADSQSRFESCLDDGDLSSFSDDGDYQQVRQVEDVQLSSDSSGGLGSPVFVGQSLVSGTSPSSPR